LAGREQQQPGKPGYIRGVIGSSESILGSLNTYKYWLWLLRAKAGVINSLESIPGLHKSFKISLLFVVI
jgi:hypothetical protein